jgi:uncharacterized protein (DUF1778 family)
MNGLQAHWIGLGWITKPRMAISTGPRPCADLENTITNRGFGLPGPTMAVASDRLDLKLSSEDKELLSQAAAIEGLSLAAFVRSAAKKQALDAFHAAIHEPFRPAPPLEDALQRVRSLVRRA